MHGRRAAHAPPAFGARAAARLSAQEDALAQLAALLHKIVSERPQDQTDVRGVVRRRLENLDLTYLEPRIAELARLLDRPEIERNWAEWKREASAQRGRSGG